MRRLPLAGSGTKASPDPESSAALPLHAVDDNRPQVTGRPSEDTLAAVAGKHWRLEVTELGGLSTLYEGVLNAPTWLAALQQGRRQLGDAQDGLPPGASCSVAPDGVVTIHDARGRRRYELRPVSTSALPPALDAPQTVTAKEGPDDDPPANDIASRWMPKGRDSDEPPQPSSPPPADVEHALTLVTHRDEEPSKSNPILFRERMYAVNAELHPGTGEKLAIKLLRQIQAELVGRQGAKFVHLAIFDHEWQERPARPPVVRLQWKDWRKAIDIEFPLEDSRRSGREGRTSSMPPAPADDRLAVAFEACRDLLFFDNRGEALQFALRLLQELIPADASAACLFDINTDEFCFVATEGTAADTRRGRAVASATGLFGAAAELGGKMVLELADASEDPRFDAHIDGVPGMRVGPALYCPLVSEGRLLGMLQLLRQSQSQLFHSGDRDVMAYVSEQLGLFVARGRSVPPASAIDEQ